MTIKITTTSKEISAFGGLTVVHELLDKVNLRCIVDKCLPSLISGNSRSFDKMRNLIIGMIAGADCLEDFDVLKNDNGFVAACNERAYTSKSLGNFLRSFSELQLQFLQECNLNLALKLRSSLDLDNDRVFTLDCDSTKNKQYGLKMEGVEACYEGYRCLDTLNIYDKYGLQYFLDVRPGATHTSNGSGVAMQKVIKAIYSHDKYKKSRIWVRADSGYYGVEFMNSCLAAKSDFVIAVNKGGHFENIANKVTNWAQENLEDEDRIKFYDGRECEIGTTSHRPKDSARALRYVIMRAKKKTDEDLLLESEEYDYFAFCTSLDEVRLPMRELIFYYRKRGHAENFIREAKNGFDLKHYPCLKLSANQAFGLITQLAYNFARFLALAEDPQKTKYIKKIRNLWILIPCLVTRIGGNRVFKFMRHHEKEISLWLKRIHKLSFV